MSTALVRTNDVGETKVILIRDDDQVEITRLYRFDMSILTPISNLFTLTRKQNNAFLNALVSEKGREILYALKNQKTDEIISEYLEEQKRQIGTYNGQNLQQIEQSSGIRNNNTGEGKLSTFETKKPKLTTFVEEVGKERFTRIGTFGISPVTIGLTKKELFEAFVAEGLI